MKRFRLKVLSIIILLILSVGCQAGSDSNATPTTQLAATDPLVSPLNSADSQAQGTHQTSPLEPSTLSKLQEVTPGPDSGVVRGILQQYGAASPIEGKTIYLAGFVTATEDEDFKVARIAAGSDPYTEVGADGFFSFTDVQPGEYTLAAVTPLKEYILLVNLDTGKEIIFQVDAGQITDLGVMPVDMGY